MVYHTVQRGKASNIPGSSGLNRPQKKGGEAITCFFFEQRVGATFHLNNEHAKMRKVIFILQKTGAAQCEPDLNTLQFTNTLKIFTQPVSTHFNENRVEFIPQ